jgi:starch synthase
MEALEFWGLTNLLKGGIVFADFVTTVSEKYATEILTQEYGWGLEGVLNKYKFKLKGVINGIDYDTWNPETDSALWFRYSASDVDNKFLNKEKFCQAYSLNQEKPLISFISRLSYQKGVHLILESIKDIAYLDANFFFLGSGEYEQAFSDFSNIYKNIRVSTRFQDELSRKLFAASDFILMPSMFEPCGITQMIGMRYGCVPIVRKTGGLEETVKDIAEGGYGIVFDNPSKGEFMCAIKRAIDLYDNREKFVEKVKTVMQLDFSSETMAEKYMQIYKSLLGM